MGFINSNMNKIEVSQCFPDHYAGLCIPGSTAGPNQASMLHIPPKAPTPEKQPAQRSQRCTQSMNPPELPSKTTWSI